MEVTQKSDAIVYLTIAQRITSNGDVPKILTSIGLLTTNQLKYTTKANILALILVFTYPTTISAEVICEWIRLLNLTGEEEIDLEEYANSLNSVLPDVALVQTAEDLLKSVNEEVAGYGFKGDRLVDFVRAKTLHWGKYTNDIALLDPLFQLVDNSDFDSWYNGIVAPYMYYSHYVDANLDFYLNSNEFSDQFNILIEPFLRRTVPVSDWMTNVILPLVKYHDYNVDPLLAWLYCPQNGKPLVKYELWHEVLASFVDSDWQFSQYREIVRCYLASVYYYSKDEVCGRIPTIEITKIYDVIKLTLSLFDMGHPQDINLGEMSFLSFEEFITDESNPLRPFFEPTPDSFATLNKIILTCQKLLASNKLTIHQYLLLKSSDNVAEKEREISKCCAYLTKSNWAQWTVTIKDIIDTFVNENERNRIDALIIERFLFANLFDVIDNFKKTGKLKIDNDAYYQLVMGKFWDSFNAATNMNDKNGHLKDATDVLKLFDDLDLLESQHQEVIRIKHLLKAINNMKNYRIIFDRSGQLTPGELVQEFKYNPLELTTVILEQNTKSYLSFTKLYKILNDMSIFFEMEENYFNKLKTACIESSLIDGNFLFAYKQTMELLEHYNSNDLNDNWLTFYQVGKYINPNWFDGESQEKLDVLQRQGEILAKTLSIMNSSNENSQTVLRQWTLINSQINEFYSPSELDKIKDVSYKNTAKPKEIGDMAKNYIQDVTATGSHASEKISNMFVSGLGWAIGANK